MNISFVQLKGVVRELSAICRQLERIGDCLEHDLADKGIRVRSKDEPVTNESSSLDYVDEEADWARENIPNFDVLMKNQPKE